MPEKVVDTAARAYLLGLIAGRGHFYTSSYRIAIEFSHANKSVAKITHCDACGDLVTGFQVLVCKGCQRRYDPAKVVTVEQVAATTCSLQTTIIPFLQSGVKAVFDIVGNPGMTLLVLDFAGNRQLFQDIYAFFSPAQSFAEFHIPAEIKIGSQRTKIEFVNGLLDTAGFNNAGGWYLSQGRHAHGRMRSYFQIVRNWRMPVEIDNFLRRHFSLPIQTIDWGHPNIRDSNLRDYYESNAASWSREHQVKFYPEYYRQFHFRLAHKQELFEDLIAHNEYAGFDKRDDWFPPSKIRDKDIKPYHPGESDLRIPAAARRHFDKFWQVSAALGCEYMQELQGAAQHPACLLATGRDEPCDLQARETEWEEKRQALTAAIRAKYAGFTKAAAQKQAQTGRSNPEQQLYAPLTAWFVRHLSATYEPGALAFDVSAGNLNYFIGRNQALLEALEDYNYYRIKPDIVGFLPAQKKLAFIEAKVTALSLKEIGQLLGYCLVANPVEAWLISTKPPSASLLRVLQSKPALLQYAHGRSMQLGLWQHGMLTRVKV